GANETLPSAEVSAVTADNGSVALTWTAVPGATSYRIYRGDSAGGESLYFTAAGTSFTDFGAAGTPGTPPTTSTVLASQVTSALNYNAPASGSTDSVQYALEHLAAIGTGNVAVTRNDRAYVIRFQGSLSDSVQQPLVAHPTLTKAIEPLGGVGL